MVLDEQAHEEALVAAVPVARVPDAELVALGAQVPVLEPEGPVLQARAVVLAEPDEQVLVAAMVELGEQVLVAVPEGPGVPVPGVELVALGARARVLALVAPVELVLVAALALVLAPDGVVLPAVVGLGANRHRRLGYQESVVAFRLPIPTRKSPLKRR